MHKSGIIVVVSGALIVIGLILLALGNQVILEGVTQGNGKVSSGQSLTISSDFNSNETSIGVFAVQVMGLRDNMLSAKIMNPSDNEITSQEINEETIEKEFDIIETGIYKLIIQSIDDKEIHVFAAIGPLPDAGKKSLSFISVYIVIIGMVGLIGVGVYKVKNRKRSI